MEKIRFSGKKKAGMAPGEVVIDTDMVKPKIRITDYMSDSVVMNEYAFDTDAYRQLLSGTALSEIPSDQVRWIDIYGLGDERLFDVIKRAFKIHDLIIEDVLNQQHRGKAEFFQDYFFVIAKDLSFSMTEDIQSKQLSMICGTNYVITFQYDDSRLFQPIIDRIKTGNGIVRRMKADYLAYLLLDIVFDYYFPLIEEVSAYIETIEEMISEKYDPDTVYEINHAKRVLIRLKREIWPAREMISRLMRESSDLLSDKVRIYLRDLSDHILQTVDMTESLKDLTTELLNTYLTMQGNRMNEIMKVLTIISTLFIPLSFLAGIYGMNFKYIPELESSYGYFILIGVMSCIAIFMLLVFRKIGWIGRKRKK
ncbi:MAG TPA: magnesium/cobalt transporter CorA [Thermotogota bacterium]|nr:magnesium/cobalt transporter CorA [Thermotogota bacterium]HPJ89910.1 magnesium/cobalt transporter CorA [Thermotogota bacterium]HPR96540.1 magnesium/cobalt transporter CorA [Thermotogota bacterium]